MTSDRPRTVAHRIRRWVVGAIIVSFGIAALGGIAVLLSGAWSDTAGRVLATTALVGLFSVAVLCGVTLFEKPVQWFGWVTVGLSVVTLAWVLWLVWADDPSWGDFTFEFTVTMCVFTAACAVAALLLLLVAHNRQFVRVLLYVTLGLMALGVLLSLLPVWRFEPGDYESYWRATGVVWILAALGIVVLPVTSLLPRATQPADRASREAGVPAESAAQPAPVAPVAQLSQDSLERIARAAQAEGVTPDEFVRRLLP